MRWNEKQNPLIKIVPPRHKKQDARDAAEAENSQADVAIAGMRLYRFA